MPSVFFSILGKEANAASYFEFVFFIVIIINGLIFVFYHCINSVCYLFSLILFRISKQTFRIINQRKMLHCKLRAVGMTNWKYFAHLAATISSFQKYTLVVSIVESNCSVCIQFSFRRRCSEISCRTFCRCVLLSGF